MSTKLEERTGFKSATLATRTPGVARASLPFQKLKQRLVLVVVLLPFLGFVAALALLPKYSIGPLELGLLLGMYALSILGISVGFHRHLAHRAFQAHWPTRAALIILGSMAVQGPILTWAAVHRRHHQYSDHEGDPHSPYLYSEGRGIRGLWRGFWHSDWGRYVPDLLRDKLVFRLSRFYFIWIVLGLLIPAAVGGLVTRSWVGALNGFLWGGLVRIFLVHHVSWTIGSVCHIYGSRPFETKDYSTNNAWLSLLTVGDSWHNNHHAFPSSAWHGLKWWQLDVAGLVIGGLELAGLAWNVEKPTPQMMRARRRRASS
jgi:stearoyl-CoA desaturase (delta-9 desaturase)